MPAASNSTPSGAKSTAIRRRLLAWYGRHRRVLPWRAEPGESPDAYRVWLSEIMLQQTTVAAVVPYFEAFTRRWPTLDRLARAPLDEVLHAWQGLGYYRRAHKLHECARLLVSRSGGNWPTDESGLLALPGIGPYTAAAMAAIAFGRPAAPVDGNILRVMARLYAVEAPLPAAKPELGRLAAGLAPHRRAGDFAQALMDLGATVCTPRAPACPDCPLASHCAARAKGLAAELPRRTAKAAAPRRRAIAFWAVRGDGAVLLRRRDEKGLLAGMMELPSTPWRGAPWRLKDAMAHAPAPGPWRALPGVVTHVFTHMRLETRVLMAEVDGAAAGAEGTWCRPARFKTLALPSLTKKLCRHALAAASSPAPFPAVAPAFAPPR
jgi:A/G-specific adenine glycosylase